MADPPTSKPTFDVPHALKNKRLWAQRKVPDGYSDGEQRHWPGGPQYRPSAQEFYLCTLGQGWAEHDGIAQPGVQFYLDKLPDGYAMFETDQPGGPQTYKRLFGHPTGRFYDSAARFLPHFIWLMSGMDGECECVHCAGKAKPVIHRSRAPREIIDKPAYSAQKHIRNLADEDEDSNESSRAGSMGPGVVGKRSQRQVRQPGMPQAVDEEGTEDIYKDCVKKLENAKDGHGIEIDLTEEGSIDWKADRQSLPQYLTRIEQQHSFIPRIGELVLWCPNFLDEHYLMLDQSTSEYKFYSFEQKCFHGFPEWRGGVVAAAPSAGIKNGPIDFTDILDVPAKKTSFNTAGFRIETMPDPNDDMNKSMSKQYKYVPLRNIRPLAHWKLLLRGIQTEKRHPSIEYALTCLTSLSLLEKWKFNGDWLNARIFCKGVYLGSELIVVGDTVRLLPSNPESLPPQPDVLVVESIRYNLRDMQPEHARADNPRLSNGTFITLIGSAYTTDKDKLIKSHLDAKIDTNSHDGLKTSKVKTIFRSVGAEEYGLWYPWHSPHQRFEVSHERVLGRLFEADAVRLWNGQRQSESPKSKMRPSLDFDVNSVLTGRRYATMTDARLAEPQSKTEINWFLADTRVEALALATVNGIDVTQYHEVRTPLTLKQWRMQVKVADGQQITPEVDAYIRDLSVIQLSTSGRRGRPVGSKLVDGKLVLPGQHIAKDGDDETEEERMKPSSQMAGAAMASDTDNTSEEYYSDELEEIDTHDPAPKPHLVPKSQKVFDANPTLSKAAIMSSIEVPEDGAFDNDISDDDTWLEHLPLARGGTEESEGGDYRE